MKRIVFVLVAVLMLMSMLLSHSTAEEFTDATDSYIYLENGDYIRIETESMDSRQMSRKVGRRTYIYSDKNDVEQWRATLTGSFTYTGTSVTCTSSNCSVSITDSAWSVVSQVSDKSGNSATATVIMEKRLLGVVISQEELNMKLTCDSNGNLS